MITTSQKLTPISLFADAFKQAPEEEAITLADFLEGIEYGRWKTDVENVRALASTDRTEYDKKKRDLPAVSLSCHCLSRKRDASPEEKGVTHSGWLQADFDLKDNPVLTTPEEHARMRQQLLADPHVHAVFVGPSGEGLKAAVAIPADLERHKDSWFAAEAHFRQRHGLKLDQSTKDPMRLCFVSYDPDLATSDQFEPIQVAEQQRTHTPPPPSSPDLPPPTAPLQNPKGWIILPSGPTGNYDSSVTLFEAMRRTGVFFLRGGKTCEVRVDENDFRKRVEIIKPMELVSTCERLGAPVAAWGVDDKKRPFLRPGARASKSIAEMWLESSARHALPPIKSVLNCPALALDGEDLILLAPGYHEPTGTLVASDIQIDTEMTHEEALDAIDLLLRDFDFVTPADRARALAMFVTPALVAGGLLKAHIPIFGVEANASQSGKGYLCELVQTVYAETPSIVTKKEGGVGSFDESLAAALISGRPFIQIDNVRNKLASQFFEMVMTAPKGGTVSCRTPHRAEVKIDPSRVIFHITSNGLEMTEDLANRACIVRIRKRERWNPPRFPEGGLLDHVAANRHRFLGAIFHLVARWVEEGRQRTEDTRAPGRFREWGQTLDWIVQELAGCPPLLDGHEQVQARVASPGLVWVRDMGMKITASHPDRHEGWTSSNLVEFAGEQGITIPGTKDDGDKGASSRAVGRIMGRLFGNSREVVADDILVSREETASEREDGNGTRILKTYRFERTSPQSPQSPQCT